MNATVHAHRFLIETPNGPTCKGECACGETRVYSSSGDEEGVWSTSMQATRKRAGAAMKAKKGGAQSAAQMAAFYRELSR